MKVMIVENDRRTAAFGIKGLQQEGFTIDHASDGEEGLACAMAGNGRKFARLFDCMANVITHTPLSR